jgi:hypothetical protein
MAPGDIRKVRKYSRLDDIGNTPEGADPFSEPDDYGSPDPTLRTDVRIPPMLARPSASSDDPSIDYQQIAEGMKKLYTPEHAASDRFDQLLKEYPTERSPGIARTLVAIGAGMGKGTMKDQQEILDEPYKHDVEDWKNKTEPEYQAASLERQSNTNNRQLAGQMVNSDINNRRYINAAGAADERNRIASQKATDAAAHQKRVDDLLDLKTKGYTYSVVGNKLMAHAQDGSSFEAGEASSYDPIELEKLKQQGRMEVVTKQGTNAVTTKEATPGATPGSSELNARRERNRKFQEEWDNNPASHKFLVKPAQVNGDWQFNPPKGNSWSASTNQKDFQDFSAIKNRVTPPQMGAGTPAKRPVPNLTGGGQTPPPKAAAGNVKVQHNPTTGKYRVSTDGGKTWKETDKNPYGGQ